MTRRILFLLPAALFSGVGALAIEHSGSTLDIGYLIVGLSIGAAFELGRVCERES